jgi:large subunit ribosomal protein L24
MHIKKGDNVVLLTGDDKGKSGKVEKIITKNGTAVVEGLNMKKRHQKARKEGAKGQMVEVAMPIRVSNLAKADKVSKRKK